MAGWRKFPHPDKAYEYEGTALRKAWPRLHRGDCEDYPPGAKLQDAWRAYHRGDFEESFSLGLALGDAGINVANKAQIIYATYLEDNEKKRLGLFEEAARRAESYAARAKTDANGYYFQALALGRYSQGISVVTALAQGLGGKIHAALEHAVEFNSKHADAHIALGAYHAEVIDKVGASLGNLAYGATRDKGVLHFERALKLNPDSAIARIEYANGLVMLFGKSKMDKAIALYEEAAVCTPADAMERLDIELAKSELEE
ncbi:MAG: hypothetical protein D4R84_17970 [Rhodocyclaceae bacterium]|nr:MAG: hypothetical protein D4R84_17970 [Rhodocyclaceae bacterium]